ncbi:MAG TPA: PIG-L deacetylase family protein [Acidimicrobiia bacterium]|nr:PIG-L deacetylase family protein [Acidimicrobiia bacterium]
MVGLNRTVRSRCAWLFHATARRVTYWRAAGLRAPATGSCLVLAPHPDDEVLGCGATIARKAAAGTPVTVVIASDGELSDGAGRASEVVGSVRRAEALDAARALGLPDAQVTLLGLPDGSLAAHEDRLVVAICDALEATAPAQVFVCTAADGHIDHVALNRATREALGRTDTAARLFEYPIWAWMSWPWPMVSGITGQRRSIVAALRAALSPELVRVRAGKYRRAKRRALACYESQLGSPEGGVGEGLPPNMLKAFDAPYEVFVGATP